MVEVLPRQANRDAAISQTAPETAPAFLQVPFLMDESFRTARELLLVVNWLTERSERIDE